MGISRKILLSALFLLVLTNVAIAGKTENVIMITIDGMRWQEIFTGADSALLNGYFGGVQDLKMTKERFWRDTPEARREMTMPFFWGMIGKQGQIFGDPEQHCDAMVTNGKKISYPGYSEMFCGFADPKIETNGRIPNPNVSVLEWLNGKPSFKGRVAAYGTWDRLPSTPNAAHTRLPRPARASPTAGPLQSDKERQ